MSSPWKKISLEIDNTTPPSLSANTGIIFNKSQNIGSISGTAFDDQNANGFREAEEPGLSGWTIILKRDGMEPSQTITDDAGHYSFAVLEPGAYRVEENILSGWNQTYPPEGSYNITFIEGQGLDYDFGNHRGLRSAGPQNQTHPLISREEWIKTVQLWEAASNASPSAKLDLPSSYPASFSLLSMVPSYSTRNQGGCGNCWAWAGTGATEVAHYAQLGILDRLSVQYLNSNYNGGSGSWACCGGNTYKYLVYSINKGKFVPWNNLGAQYRDSTNHCCLSCTASVCGSASCCSVSGCGGAGQTSAPANTITESPSYPFVKTCTLYSMNHGISQDSSIDVIKSALTQNKALIFSFYLPSKAAWDDFNSKWNTGGIWDPAPYCGISSVAGNGGHAVLCVGYDDATDTWIMLNSWGAGGRGDGTFRVKMHMNYDCSNDGTYSYLFEYFDIEFGKGRSYLGNYKGNGIWAVDYNGNGAWDGTATDRVYSFGSSTDLPVVGDWTGDRKVKVGNYKGNGVWALDYNGNGAWDGTSTDRVFVFGGATDQPVVGDWNGDGKDEIGNYKGNGVWALDYNGNGAWDGTSTDRVFVFGGATDLPVVGDWNGNGKDEVGNYKGNGVWALDYNGNGRWDGTSTDRVFVFGGATDKPVVGDWNQDGRDELGNYKSNGVWALDYNGNGAWDGTITDRVFVFGSPTDKPVVGRW